MALKDVVAAQIKKTLTEKGMQQNELAKKTGFTTQAVNNYCTGKNLPGAEALVTISNALGVSVDDLLGNNGVVSSKKEHSLSELLNAMVVIADGLDLDVVACPDCEYHLVYKTFSNSHSFEEEAESASIAGFFDSWIKYRDLLKERHITSEEYNSLIESRIHRA